MIGAVPWFHNLGAPNDADAEVIRIHTWDEWPGPEDPGCMGSEYESEKWRERIFYDLSLGRDAVDLWNRIQYEMVIPLASKRVDYDEALDCYHAPNSAVWHAGWLAAVIGCRLLLGFGFADNALRQWDWFARGHWPFGYDEVDERCIPYATSKLQVF